MRSASWNRPRRALLGIASAGMAVAAVATGCGAHGIGIGSTVVALAAGVIYLLLAAGPTSGCYGDSVCLTLRPDRPDLDGDAEVDGDGDVEARQEACLSPPWDVCLSDPGAGEDAEPPRDACLEPPWDVCLTPEPPDARDTDGDALPPCPPEMCDICLFVEPDWCILECPVDGGDSASADPPRDAASRLASAGVLTRDQARRLARLRGGRT